MASRTGSVKKHRGKWSARVTFTDSAGKRHETRVTAASKSKACDDRDAILRDVANLGPDEYIRRKDGREHPLSIDPPSVETGHTLGGLALHYREEYACEPKAREGHRYAGMNSWKRVREHIAILERELGKELPLSELTFDRVRALKVKRLDTPVQLGKSKEVRPRSFANVHRTLAILRRMIVIAIRNGWMTENPFVTAAAARESLISPGMEKQRSRVLTPAEEKRLLAALEVPALRRSRLGIIALIDTGARVGELIERKEKDNVTRRRLRWSDIDLKAGTAIINASKTETERSVGLSPRLLSDLKILYKTFSPAPGDEVFSHLSYNIIRDDFAAARAVASIDNLTLHDLRHTRATRWIQGGLNESEVGHLLGHSKKSHVTRRYINPDERTIERALAADARFVREHGKPKRVTKEAVN